MRSCPVHFESINDFAHSTQVFKSTSMSQSTKYQIAF